MRLRLGSLFSGWGGLDMAIEAAFASIGVEVELAWVSDIEQYDKKGHRIGDAPAILAYRYPDVPNLGDITRVDWAKAPDVHIIGGGSPCQDVSTAGQLAGMTEGTRSNLWVEMREAIRVLEPAFVVWENVRGALSAKASSKALPEHIDRAITHHRLVALETSHAETKTRHTRAALRLMERRARYVGVAYPKPALRAFGRVLGDLAELGFDAEWIGISASDIGAPHGRFREFILAAHPERLARLEWRQSTARETARGGHSVQLHDVVEHLATDAEDDRPIRPGTPRRGGDGPADGDRDAAVALLPTPSAINPNDGEAIESWKARRERVKATANNGNGMGTPLSIAVRLLPTPSVASDTWGPYAAAIARWEAIHGPAPAPTKTGKKGNRKLNPAFSAWMMGAPAGWITDVPGITDNQASHAIGNGVVPHQGAAALRILLDRISRWDDQ